MRLSGRLLPIALLGLLAGAVSAQQRPTLSETESRVDQLELLVQGLLAERQRTRESVCGAADVAGESYRPYVCDARCDCFTGTTGSVGGFTSCAESVSGQYDLDFEIDRGPCEPDDTCRVQVGAGFVCATSSFAPCPCSGTESCLPTTSGSVCVQACNSAADCPARSLCAVQPVTSCTVDAQCEAGEICDRFATATCVRTCTSGAECMIPGSGSLVGVAETDSTSPVTCTGELPSALTINANDALECLAQAGAGLGAACASICGNGVVGPGETCDDGNTTPGDGCDAVCQLEP